MCQRSGTSYAAPWWGNAAKPWAVPGIATAHTSTPFKWAPKTYRRRLTSPSSGFGGRDGCKGCGCQQEEGHRLLVDVRVTGTAPQL
jgi:hypothetical protein